MRRSVRLPALAAAASLVAAALVATAVPATAITGGQPDGEGHPNVGLIAFYSEEVPDSGIYYRFRCSATLVAPNVLLTAAHCTEGTARKTIVTFDSVIAEQPPAPIPRAEDDTADTAPDGLGSSRLGYSGENLPSGWYAGTAETHPLYSDFTDLKNWNDVGVVVLDQPITGISPAKVAPSRFLDQFTPNILNKTLFTPVGYGTEVRKPDAGPQKPTPMSYPLIRRVTTSNGQKLTDQILQTNGVPNNQLGDGGTCFGDSGGPTFKDGYVVTVTSYGYTNNCRYLDGLQRVDIPVVQDWLDDYGVQIG